MQIAKSPLNKYALVLENAQTDIREIVKLAYLRNEPTETTRRKILNVINRATERIEIQRLREDARRSLMVFANEQKRKWEGIGFEPAILLLLGKASNNYNSLSSSSKLQLKAVDEQILPSNDRTYETTAKGIPLQKYYQEVWKERVKPILDDLAVKEQARDPNDQRGYNTLRNLAEMEVRYQDHLDNINELKENGVNIVVCSAHADCSERCAPWQGRLYSLNGTTGTIDGQTYIPLETATDVYYTTKSGRVYKNGLLGFNCRHKLYKYEGHLLPTVSAKQRAKEYAITQKQRSYELEVRKEKELALINKGINQKDYIEHKKNAKKLYSEYVNFSMKNERAFYPMRVEL